MEKCVPKGLRNLLFAVVYCISVFGNVVYASTEFVVEITVNSLNVRDQPSTKGNVIGKLKKGEQVIASPTYSGWAMTLIHGKKPGYFSTKYIKIVKIISSKDSSTLYGDEEEIKCNADSANLSLSITNVDFKCEKNLFGKGYQSCSAWFDVAIISNCKESMSANVVCDAEFKYETKDGFMPLRASKTGSDTIFLIAGLGNGKIKVNWQPMMIIDHVIRVKLNDGSCSITSTYDY